MNHDTSASMLEEVLTQANIPLRGNLHFLTHRNNLIYHDTENTLIVKLQRAGTPPQAAQRELFVLQVLTGAYGERLGQPLNQELLFLNDSTSGLRAVNVLKYIPRLAPHAIQTNAQWTGSVLDELASFYQVKFPVKNLFPTFVESNTTTLIRRFEQSVHGFRTTLPESQAETLSQGLKIMLDYGLWALRQLPVPHDGQLIHGDPKIENTIITGDANAPTLIDWESIKYGNVNADLACIRHEMVRMVQKYDEWLKVEHLLDNHEYFASRWDRDMLVLEEALRISTSLMYVGSQGWVDIVEKRLQVLIPVALNRRLLPPSTPLSPGPRMLLGV